MFSSTEHSSAQRHPPQPCARRERSAVGPTSRTPRRGVTVALPTPRRPLGHRTFRGASDAPAELPDGQNENKRSSAAPRSALRPGPAPARPPTSPAAPRRCLRSAPPAGPPPPPLTCGPRSPPRCLCCAGGKGRGGARRGGGKGREGPGAAVLLGPAARPAAPPARALRGCGGAAGRNYVTRAGRRARPQPIGALRAAAAPARHGGGHLAVPRGRGGAAPGGAG